MFEPLPDDEQLAQENERPAINRTQAVVAVLALSVFGFGSYAIHEHGVASKLNEQNAAITASLKSTNSQIEQLSAKINEIAAPKPQPVTEVAHSAAKPKAASSRSHRQTASASHRVRRDDPRWKKIQSQLDAQGNEIASTRQDLSSTKQDLSNTRTELTGSIARTHGELVVLQKKGERRYYEFDVNKSKQFNPAGTMSVKLRKSNVKHQFADLDLLVDDRVVTKKHVNLYEPTMFYTGDNEQPIQVVINSITKNHIHGYVSEPKYQKSELAAMQDAGSDASQNPPLTVQQKDRQRLAVGGR